MKLTLLVGPPGSGKSTLSRDRTQNDGDHGASTVYVNQDKQGRDHIHIFDMAVLDGKDIIVDRMNFSKGQRSRYLDLAKSHGYETEIIVLHQPYDTCFDRIMARKDHETIKDEKNARAALNTFFTKYERVQDSEADKVTRVWPEGKKTSAIWVDMDNTLSDATHREHFLQQEKKNWKGFFDSMSEDIVNEWCKALVNSVYRGSEIEVLICSARPDDYRKITVAWMINNDVNYHKLIMRARGDFRKDSIVKEIMYEFEIKTRYNLLFSVDDRKQVIDQMRSHGLIVLDCAGEKGNF